MTFIQDHEKSKIILPSYMNVSPDKKYLAVCETSEDDISNLNFQAMATGGALISPQPPTPQVLLIFYIFSTIILLFRT